MSNGEVSGKQKNMHKINVTFSL